MHNNENVRRISKFLTAVGTILPALFWLALIFSFDTPKIATLTLIAIAIHECGHLMASFLFGNGIKGFRGALSGLRIRSRVYSYNTEFIVYLAGPLANLLAAVIYGGFLRGEYAAAFITVNLATCVSNLLPAEGYDGYGMVRCLLMKKGFSQRDHRILEYVSLFTAATFCVLALYLIDRFSEGYWIFFVFFVSTLKKISNLLKDVKCEK